MITLDGTLQNLTSDISEHLEDNITSFKGSTLQFNISMGTMFLTANINDYKRYSVKMELYEYGAGVLADLAVPTYEFSVKSANFLFASEFAPFKNSLELGKGIYLNIGNKKTITPYIIEFEIDFENRSSISVIFSNRFKRHDNVNTLGDMIKKSYSSSRSFDAGKYVYNQAANQATRVSEFMNSALDAAVNSIIAASNQSVIINGSGIHIGANSPYQIRIVDSMIAMSNDNWSTAKLALGLFKTENSGEYFGINAEVIGGKLIVGNNLIIENMTDDGVMQFMADSSGVWLNNATFVLQNLTGGNILIDPDYGILAGNNKLYTTEGTSVIPSFVNDDDGEIIFDTDGMPQNTNFFLDIQNGNAYFRGKVTATSGRVGGFKIEDNFLHAGSDKNYVALNGSGDNEHSLYAMWAGAYDPALAPYAVKKDGSIYAYKGSFAQCTISGSDFRDLLGRAMMDDDYKFTSSYLNLKGINVGNGNFVVDPYGNVTVKGTIEMGAGSTISWKDINETESASYKTAGDALTVARSANEIVNNIANGKHSGGTFIDGNTIYSPNIYTNHFAILPDETTWNGSSGFTLRGYLDNTIEDVFDIYYEENVEPTTIMSACGRLMFASDVEIDHGYSFSFSRYAGQPTIVYGHVDFSNATITGLMPLTEATFG
jgi:hypothetical protein